MNGVLLINKEEGITSRDVVNKVGKILGTKNDEISKNGGNIKSKDIYW